MRRGVGSPATQIRFIAWCIADILPGYICWFAHMVGAAVLFFGVWTLEKTD
jgi:hypothetical protein